MKNHIQNTIKFVFIGLFIFAGIGCAGMKKASDPFTSKKRVNLSPFVDQLVSLIGNIEFGMQEKRPIYIEKYLNTPEVDDLAAKANQFRYNSGKIIAYSSKVIVLAQSDMTEPEKVQAFADFVEGMRPFQKKPMEIDFDIPPEKIDELLQSARAQETLIDALAVVQPIASGIAIYMRDSITEIDDSLEQTQLAINNRINGEHKELLAYMATIKTRRNGILVRLQQLESYRTGNQTALKQVMTDDDEITTILGTGKNVSYKKLNEVENILTERIALLKQQYDYLNAGIGFYKAEKDELNEIVDSSNESLRKAKLAVLLWGRMHQMMAAGITDPAKIDVFKMMTSAVDKVL